MDLAAIGSRDAVLAVCARFRVDFAQAEDYLLARQLGQAEERAAVAEQQQEEEEEDEEDDEEDEEEDVIVPMPGQNLVSVGAVVMGTEEEGFQDGAAAAPRRPLCPATTVRARSSRAAPRRRPSPSSDS